jgi:hypothetical protein
LLAERLLLQIIFRCRFGAQQQPLHARAVLVEPSGNEEKKSTPGAGEKNKDRSEFNELFSR